MKLLRLFLSILILIFLLIPIPTHAQTEVRNIYKTKTWEALTFGGETSYSSMYFDFRQDGTINVSDSSNNLIIPASLNYLSTIENRDLVIQTYKDFSIIYDFSIPGNKVKISYKGDYTGILKVPVYNKASLSDSKVATPYSFTVGKYESNELVSGLTYDWSDATQYVTDKDGSLEFTVNGKFDIDPSIIGTSTNSAMRGFGRYTVYASGRHWVFYFDGTNHVFRSSTDGVTWSDTTTANAGIAGTGYQISVYYDGTYISYALIDNNADVKYRRGTPNSDGTITWSADQQNVYTGTASRPCITVSSGGYPFITYTNDSTTTPHAINSTANDGTWTTGTDQELTAASVNAFAILEIDNDDIYVLYDGGTNTYGRLWNGAWQAEETVTTTDGQSYYCSTAVSYGTTIEYFFTGGAAKDVRVITYSAGAWGGETQVYDGTNALYSAVGSLINASGDVIVFWAEDPTGDHIYYKERISGTWDAAPTDWITEPDMPNSYTFNGGAGGNTVNGVLYFGNSASPYELKYAFISYIEIPTVTNAAADTITETSAKLYGEITVTGGINSTVRGFEWDTNSGAPYANDWHENGSYGLGTFNHIATGLPSNTTIYWRVYATNTGGTGVSAERNFDTLLPLPLAPTTLSLTETDVDEITLGWTKGTYADNTTIRMKIDSFPTSPTDGFSVYNNTGVSTTDSGLTLSTVVYYIRAWSTNATGTSTEYAEATIGGLEMTTLVATLLFVGLACLFSVLGHLKREWWFSTIGVMVWLVVGFWWLNAGVDTLYNMTGTYTDIVYWVPFFLSVLVACDIMNYWNQVELRREHKGVSWTSFGTPPKEGMSSYEAYKKEMGKRLNTTKRRAGMGK